MSRILGIDYGTQRIGLAISDSLGLTARPLEVVGRGELSGTLRRIDREYGVERVVVGLPTGLSGKEGTSAEGARQLGDEVGKALGVDVEYVDERFTSRIAEGALLESGMKRRDRKGTVDKVAAAIILQTYLDSLNSNAMPEPTDEPSPNQ
ncbi:MAG TPA: Holliday junction resolvase RuvX [Acidimicrobiia bacterium]|nr:Holliday junction resolvase RuvX [Acidimicrobiia bacterium]